MIVLAPLVLAGWRLAVKQIQQRLICGSDTRRIERLVDRFAKSTLFVFTIPDLELSSPRRGQWSNLVNIPIIRIDETPFWGVDGWLKRISDLIIAGGALLLSIIPMLIIAIAIKLCSPGPVLFKQRRYGINGREIHVWKFRTMRVCDDGDRFIQTTRNDPRVTPLGAVLRRTSLDELPQLINVLMGDMSIVGPRPHPVAMSRHYRHRIKGYMLRYRVRPGITGWAQVNGWRGETDTPEKILERIEHDLWYIQNWSLWLDLRILLLTLIPGCADRNAY